MDLHHHEVATAGQSEMTMTFTPLTRMADNLLLYKYIIKKYCPPEWKDGHLHAQAIVRR